LSRVATDFDILDLQVTWPYILFALISGVTQYFVTKLYSAGSAATTTTEDLKDQEKARESKEHDHKKKQEEEKPDFAETMAQSTQQMNYIFPAITVLMSLGYLGGASFIPMGVTLFWTAQNGFVIIQQMISQRDRVQKDLEHRWSKLQKIWGAEPEPKNKKTN
jgi:membrane protein insertase Oxa1/YidC/SpoIIIJ